MSAIPSLTSPFKGLAPFDDSDLDALLFFGRARDTATIVANLPVRAQRRRKELRAPRGGCT